MSHGIVYINIKSIIQVYGQTTLILGGYIMRVYLQENKVTVVGKPWQIKHVLRKYMQEYNTVKEWIDAQKSTNKPRLTRIK
jgi:hypothetical protein